MSDVGENHMDRLYDFSQYALETNIYDGAAEKYVIRVDGHQYMLKFGERLSANAKRPDQTSYMNTPLNEYLGSKLYKAAGIPVQDVLLGRHGSRSVVACLDFVYEMNGNYSFQPFSRLETSMPGESSKAEFVPEWNYLRHVIDDHPALEHIREDTWSRYRQLAVMDALIGNFDRHSGNWGFIFNNRDLRYEMVAPVFDCGSSLFVRTSEEAMQRRLDNPQEAITRNLQLPNMMLQIDGKRQSYADFLMHEQMQDFRATLVELWPNITQSLTDEVVDNTPGLDQVHRDFYKQTLDIRREYILRPAYELGLREAGQYQFMAQDVVSDLAMDTSWNEQNGFSR